VLFDGRQCRLPYADVTTFPEVLDTIGNTALVVVPNGGVVTPELFVRTPRVVALEPDTSPTLTTGTGGPHRVEGTATGIVPPLLVPVSYDEARVVDEAAARALAGRLARVDGLFAGVSTALNVAGATALAAERGPGRTVVTVAVDTGLKYLAGDLFDA
jgi:cysteine synthase